MQTIREKWCASSERAFAKFNPWNVTFRFPRRTSNQRGYRITRFVQDFDALDVDQNDPWSHGHTLPIHRGGLLGWIIEQDGPVILHDLDICDNPVLGDRIVAMGSLMAIPLFDDAAAKNWAAQFVGATD